MGKKKTKKERAGLLLAKRFRHELRKRRKQKKGVVQRLEWTEHRDYAPHMLACFRRPKSERKKIYTEKRPYAKVVESNRNRKAQKRSDALNYLVEKEKRRRKVDKR